METIEELRSARSQNSDSTYKNLDLELKRDVDPEEEAARLAAASILTLEGVKQYSLTFDAPSVNEDEDTNIEELKIRRLCELHDELELPQLIVYVKDQAESDKLYEQLKLKAKHVSVVCIDDKMLDRARDTARLKFQSGFDNILIVNDEVPNHRGIEFVAYDRQAIFIINYNIPTSVPLYSKRIGRRIANYSRKGVAINFLSSSEEDHELIKKYEEFYDTTITNLNNNSHAWKDLHYFIHFCI